MTNTLERVTLTPVPVAGPSDPSAEPRCGTERGYRAHLKRGESTACGRGCREANSRAVKRRLQFRGRSVTDASAAAAHVERLIAAGMTRVAVAAAAGLSHDTIESLSDRQWIRVATAEALLAVECRPAGRGMVPGVGSVRRVRALLRIGWSHELLRAEAGVSTVMLSRRPSGTVTFEVAAAVRATFDRLSMTPGPSPLTARRAAVLGYAPPLAWDDDTIDDPTVGPQLPADLDDGSRPVDELEVELLMAGVVKVAPGRASLEKVEAIRRLAARGLTDEEIGVRVGMKGPAVCQARGRHGVPTNAPARGRVAS